MTTRSTTLDDARRQHILKAPRALRPLAWLRAGWRDLTNAPIPSLLLGFAFTAACALAYTAAVAMPKFSAAFLTFLLAIGPFLATAAYSVSRQREQGQRPSLSQAFGLVRKRALAVGLFSLVCALIAAAWVRLSGITFALYYGTLGTSAAEVARVWTGGAEAPAMLIAIATASAVLALTLFAVSALSLPMIADRNRNAIDAMLASFGLLRDNKSTMFVWMVVLVTLIGLALLANLILMPLVFPLLAFATWHSYRQLSSVE